MDNGLKTVGLSFKADGTVDFRKSLTDVNNAVNENRSAFKLAKSEWDKSTSSAESYTGIFTESDRNIHSKS